MIYIKKFIDKISLIESRQGKDVILSMVEARGLRDELAKILVDQFNNNQSKVQEEPIIQVEVKGGSFK